MSGLRIDYSDGCDRHCFRSDHRQGEVINKARRKAHAKHGQNSIEAIPYDDPRWLSILVEEVGEVAHAMTYDADASRLPEELVDVLAVASAWLDAYREAGFVAYGSGLIYQPRDEPGWETKSTSQESDR